MGKSILIILALVFLSSKGAAEGKVPLSSIDDMQVEHLCNPIAIDTKKPRFSWKLYSNGNRRIG